MLPSIKHWRDWVMHDLWPRHRFGLQPQALHYSYEKAGLTLHDQPIPWNAEAVLVEAYLRFPAGDPRRKADFQLRIGKGATVPAESLRREDGKERVRVVFRFPPPGQSTSTELLYRGCPLGQLTLPVVSQQDFTSHLQLNMPTLFARLGDECVACQTVVARQCRGLLVSGLLTSPTSLAPLADLGLRLEIRPEAGGPIYKAAAQFCSSQLAGRQALVTITLPRLPRKIGTWLVTWLLGNYTLGAQQLRAISERAFRSSLRLSDTRFVIHSCKQGVVLARSLPLPKDTRRVGPCFLISSAEPGMAGLCSLQVRIHTREGSHSPLLAEEEILVTDGPTVFAPGTVDGGDLEQISSFEVHSKGGTLGQLSLTPAPAAAFTPEGGFYAPGDFAWSATADEELHERLSRLLHRGDGP
jgi:hypothetical protein